MLQVCRVDPGWIVGVCGAEAHPAAGAGAHYTQDKSSPHLRRGCAGEAAATGVGFEGAVAEHVHVVGLVRDGETAAPGGHGGVPWTSERLCHREGQDDERMVLEVAPHAGQVGRY